MAFRVLGHSVHPMLIVFPLGLLSTSVAFDILGLTRGGSWLDISYYVMAAGLAGGALAAVFGIIDFFYIPRKTRAWYVGLWHGGGNVLVMLLFAGSWAIRTPDPANPGPIGFALSFAGLLLAVVTGWLGGELIERLGIAVHEGAHPNSPSSLSGRPASDDDSVPGRRRVA